MFPATVHVFLQVAFAFLLAGVTFSPSTALVNAAPLPQEFGISGNVYYDLQKRDSYPLPRESKANASNGNASNSNGNTGSNNKDQAEKSAGAGTGGGNVQTFTGSLGGPPPPVVPGGKGFIVDGSEFIQQGAALGRSCDVQHNACANAANSAGKGASFSVSDCDQQNTACHATISG